MRTQPPTVRRSDVSRGLLPFRRTLVAGTHRLSRDGYGVHLQHEALLTLARKVQAAADDGDVQRLQQVTAFFLEALTTHLRDEASSVSRLLPAEARILLRGQARLLTLATELIREAADGCSGPPQRCGNHTEELLASLTLQAHDERIALFDPAA